MRILINGFLILLLWAIPCRYWYVCKIKQHCGDSSLLVQQQDSVRANDLALYKGDVALLEGYEQFYFEGKAVDPLMSASNELFLDSVAGYLVANPSAQLTLTGGYRPSEEGSTSGFFENLGLARASTLRKLLESRGIAESRIGLDHQQTENEGLAYPVRFLVREGTSQDTSDAPAADAFTFSNMNFSGANFESNSAAFNPNPTFIAYADSLKTYFKLNPDKSLTVTGHTDNVGTDAFNLDLGMRRAKAVQQYLLGQKINISIKTLSAGESEPVADNGTEEGKAKNRRVNLTIN